jgi:hypothetical protein
MPVNAQSLRRARGTIAVMLVTTSLTACPQDRITEPIANLPVATASPSCGPADGPAVEITLAASDNPAGTPRANVAIYTSLSTLKGRWTLGPDVGVASYMTATGTGELARSGTVVIETIDAANTVTGTVQLVFPDAGMIRGRFRATWIARTVRCG